jgi:hypothetical protein
MTKIAFQDQSFIELHKSATDEAKIEIIISAKDQSNPLKRVINIVELTTEQFKTLISEVL